jgi:hypothetical protein
MANNRDEQVPHSHTMRVPRTRGAVTGVLLVVLGVWGALIPFIGPYFHYHYAGDATWKWTTTRLWFEVLPGAAAAVGGLVVLMAANRVAGSVGAWLAAAAGAWLVIGRDLAPVLHLGTVGAPSSSTKLGRAAEALGFFSALGALIVLLAAFALGRLAVVGVRDVRAAQDRAAQDRAAQDRAAQDRAAQDRAAQDRAAQDRAAQDRAAQEDVTSSPVPVTPRSAPPVSQSPTQHGVGEEADGLVGPGEVPPGHTSTRWDPET